MNHNIKYMIDKYLNDRLNFLLLIIKRRNHSLSRKEKQELKRLEKRGLNVGEGNIRDYISILRKKQYVTIEETKDNGITTETHTITDIGIKALKYNHLPSESKEEVDVSRFQKIQRIAIMISILTSIIAMSLGIRSCTKELKIESIENRLETIESKIK